MCGNVAHVFLSNFQARAHLRVAFDALSSYWEDKTLRHRHMPFWAGLQAPNKARNLRRVGAMPPVIPSPARQCFILPIPGVLPYWGW